LGIFNSALTFGIKHDQQNARVLALLEGLTMLHQHIAGQPHQIIRMVRHISNHHARLAAAFVDPILAGAVSGAGLAEG
jgi:hypothetical protein